jgi:ubiquinone/menaquinone biosynthesis C-methylase UbiE
MEPHNHDSLVAAQFGGVSAAYVDSQVHATGEDLLQIAAAVRGRKDATVLDLGCGGGHVSYAVAPYVRAVTAFDLSAAMLDQVGRTAAARGLANIVLQQGSVEALPYPDHAFDVVVSRFSAHHWCDWHAGLREARRVLKPGGAAVFADVVAPAAALLDTNFQAIELLRDPSHVRNHTIGQWREALAAAGFVVGAVVLRRLRLEFASWIARMNTPPVHAAAIRSLQQTMPREVRDHFAIEEDGSFTIDTACIEAG